jgi:outer membrane protein assembly factor BamB
MPTVVATTVKCPECGARLEVAGDAASATCAYCGTVSRVQRRTQVLQLPVRLPPAAAHEPRHVAKQVRNGTGKLVLAIIVLAGVGVPLAVIGALVARSLGAFDSIYWDGSHLAIADVDHDGVDDFIGLDRNLRKDRMSLAAFSGKTGDAIWHTPALGTYDDVYQDRMAVAGDVVVLADKVAHVDGFDLATGARRWHVTAPEVATPCRSPAGGPAIVETSDGAVWTVRLSDGKLERASSACDELDFGLHPVVGATEVRDSRRGTAVDGMDISALYVRGDGPRIAVGVKQPGTRIPMVAAIDGSGAMLWRAEVPGHDPLTAKTGRPEYLAVSDREVAVVYERENKAPWELVVLDRATGARRFEVVGKKSRMDVVSSVAMSRTAVAVSTWGMLVVFDLATGKLRFTIGE